MAIDYWLLKTFQIPVGTAEIEPSRIEFSIINGQYSMDNAPKWALVGRRRMRRAARAVTVIPGPGENAAVLFPVDIPGNFEFIVHGFHIIFKTGEIGKDSEMSVEDYRLLTDLHKNANRQGPGSDAETEKALDLAAVDRRAPLKVADIGCGTGASSLLLARLLNARITAVDFLRVFLDVLEERFENMGLSERVSPLCCSMDNLPFGDEEYDVIWSEGAIYNIGFERGVKDWNRYLRAGGLLVVSEITWITASRPSELQKHWDDEYPEIDVASSKIGLLEKNGYSPIGYFVLPEHCWLENYYRPLRNSFKDFLDRNGNSEEARAIVEAENREIELYEKYKNYYSYGVYVARKPDWEKP